jgi:hypothetical protein
MSTEQKKEEITESGELDASQLKPEDEILKDEPSRIEDAGPLFGEEGAEGSEDEAEPAPEAAAGEEKEPGSEEDAAAAQPEGDKEPTAEEKAEAEKAAAEKEPEKEPEKPPAGYVEIGALKEARTQLKETRKEHAREMESMRQEVASLKAAMPKEEKPDGSKWKDFKVLSAEDFQELADENPIDAIKYQQELREYEKYQDQLKAAEEEEERQVNEDRKMVERTVERISESVPGIYDENSEIRETLTTFAGEHGLGKSTLGMITDPATLILPPGAEQPVLLGDNAAELVEMIHKVHGLTKDGPTRESLKAEIEKELRATIEKETLEKFKAGSLGEEFKDIGELPSGEPVDEGIFGKTDFTEEEWARLPADRRRALLGG